MPGSEVSTREMRRAAASGVVYSAGSKLTGVPVGTSKYISPASVWMVILSI